jgi:peptidoglycan/xylan/chitin deacetylase (PgdA/CDA1 family)
MYLARTPAIVKPLLRDLMWNVAGTERTVYLTFDDGPIPGVTPWVLDLLERYGAKATFFCIGKNAENDPGILERIRRDGHSVGNHTYSHLNGWNTPTFSYLRDALRCQSITGTALFRPPYGRITREQLSALKARFQVVMWEVLSADFDPHLDGEQCFRNVVDHSTNGSIIVFHDSLKAEPRLRVALPKALEHFVQQGYAMKALTELPITGRGR